MTATPQAILDLVEHFAHNVDLYRSPSFNETQARREFIDPFFTTLGWDANNTRGVSARYREVIHEASLRVGGSATTRYYCFRVGAERKLLVAAQGPGERDPRHSAAASDKSLSCGASWS